jgi:addiction module RelB/DinJ family antitoxin
VANTSLLQVRTDPADREKAVEILEALGTNLSAVVNMLIKQIIMTRSIPFEIKLNTDPQPAAQSLEFDDAFENFSVAEGSLDPVIEGIREEFEL